MTVYQLSTLTDYSDDTLLEELRRIAFLAPEGQPLTKGVYESYSPRASYSTIQRRLGGWKQALERAGLGHLYSGKAVSEKMRAQTSRYMSNEDLIAELKRVHASGAREWLTSKDYDRHSITGSGLIEKRFGTFRIGLKVAGIPAHPGRLRQFTDQECFENIAELWTNYGRAPHYREMGGSESKIRVKTYVERWGTWRRAKQAFADWANTDDTSSATSADERETASLRTDTPMAVATSLRREADCREVRPKLRWLVLERDRFRCVKCGRSPSTHPHIYLHADHIRAVANGGKTIVDNLQALCQECNLGKGKLP